MIEAVLEIRVAREAKSNLAMLDEIKRRVVDRYPAETLKRRLQGSLQVRYGDQFSAEAKDATIDGYELRSKDEKYALQARFDGFAISHFKPYSSWEDFSAEAKTLWETFRSILKPETVVRIGTRYINVLELPIQIRDFDDYLTMSPKAPPRLRQQLAHFAYTVTMPLPELNAAATITQALQPPTEKSLPVLLDIDVFSEGSWSAASDTEIWNVIESFHQTRNSLFFESITEEMVRLCQ